MKKTIYSGAMASALAAGGSTQSGKSFRCATCRGPRSSQRKLRDLRTDREAGAERSSGRQAGPGKGRWRNS